MSDQGLGFGFSWPCIFLVIVSTQLESALCTSVIAFNLLSSALVCIQHDNINLEVFQQ